MGEINYEKVVDLCNELAQMTDGESLSLTQDGIILDQHGVGFRRWLNNVTKKLLRRYEKEQEEAGDAAVCWIEDRIVRINLEEDTAVYRVYDTEFTLLFEQDRKRIPDASAKEHLDAAIEALANEYYGPLAQGHIARDSVGVALKEATLIRHLQDKAMTAVDPDALQEDIGKRMKVAATTKSAATINYLAEEEQEEEVLASLCRNRYLTPMAAGVIADSCFAPTVVQALCDNPVVDEDILFSYLGSDIPGLTQTIRNRLCRKLRIVSILPISRPKKVV